MSLGSSFSGDYSIQIILRFVLFRLGSALYVWSPSFITLRGGKKLVVGSDLDNKD